MPRKREAGQSHPKCGCKNGVAGPSINAGPAGAAVSKAGGSNAKVSTRKPRQGPQKKNGVPHNVCNEFYNWGKCRRGVQCKFEHRRAGNMSSSPHIAHGHQNGHGSGPPRDVCPQYYNTGECDRSFDCKHKHLRANENDGSNGASLRQVPRTVAAPLLAQVQKSGLLEHLEPKQVHNTLHRFLQDDFKFKTVFDMYVFAAALSSADADDPKWNLSDGQLLLATVGDTDKNALVLIDAILCHETVSVTAGGSKTIVSFQRGYLPLLHYLASTYVLRSTLHRCVNALYGLVDSNFERIAATLETCIQASLQRKSFRDSDVVGHTLPGASVFRTITTCLEQFALRFRRAITSHPSFAPFVRKLLEWFTEWSDAVNAAHHAFDDPICSTDADQKRFVTSQLRKSVLSLVNLVEQAEGHTTRIERSTPTQIPEENNVALVQELLKSYEGPGWYRPQGPRHDNDFEMIQDVKIVPTQDELCADLPPYLPANLPGGPHHLPWDSVSRLFDIQFRLLREELVAPIRTPVLHIMQALRQPPARTTPLSKLLHGDGGNYRGSQDGADSVDFSVYTDIDFHFMGCDTHHGVAVEVSMNTPTGKPRQGGSQARAAYWQEAGKKRLMQGGLVALIWQSGGPVEDIKIYTGVITSPLDDLVKSARKSPTRLRLRISFSDSEPNMRVLTNLQHGRGPTEGVRYLVEAPMMFEALRPFLETLQKTLPSSIPFSRYLVSPKGGNLREMDIQLPAYATRPRYSMDLSCLFDLPMQCVLRPSDPASVDTTRTKLKNGSRLDETQADALLDTLISEISLVQGPPGTGKSYSGVELLRVLITNKVGPILLIAFTNHALDHLLRDILDKKITTKIVRLGSRSSDEKVMDYTLFNLQQKRGRTNLSKAAGREFRNLKLLEENMEGLIADVVTRNVNNNDLMRHVAAAYPTHHYKINNPEFWIQNLYNESEGWEDAQSGSAPTSLLDFWIKGHDLQLITPPKDVQAPGKGESKGASSKGVDPRDNRFQQLDTPGAETGSSDYQEKYKAWKVDALGFFKQIGVNGIPNAPSTLRAVSDGLLKDYDVWRMSLPERRDLRDFWGQEVRSKSYTKETAEFQRLSERHAKARKRWEEMAEQAKLEILSKAEIIGCTTNGAAKLTSLLASLAPRVLLVEEAGQVLEAHILASLVPSIEHMILIGDPLQLRPTLTNYYLSMDHPEYGPIYRFDQSLMERLAFSGLRMSRLDTQRRMRPAISDLIRSTLYPTLEDNPNVLEYPHVRGMLQDVFFMDHRNAEDGGGNESASKSNSFEVAMIKDLVMYFLRQGTYSQEGDIVVLCAYLGQLVKIRKALAHEVTIVIDERDAIQLADDEAQENIAGGEKLQGNIAKQVEVTRRVLLRTVDNFQGEEGTIVILSLVRNSGVGEERRNKGIGFLRSINRTNVALSRAKHGLYILGNAQDLSSSRSTMWRTIVRNLTEQGRLGPALSVACHRHPETVTVITGPGQLPLNSPDGEFQSIA
ncbi:hypothetical protein FRB96_002616 [Tulasnella sp. 330]|nr:hypothetical protein FRB96_002616 [Tulasnella sp. 330]